MRCVEVVKLKLHLTSLQKGITVGKAVAVASPKDAEIFPVIYGKINVFPECVAKGSRLTWESEGRAVFASVRIRLLWPCRWGEL